MGGSGPTPQLLPLAHGGVRTPTQLLPLAHGGSTSKTTLGPSPTSWWRQLMGVPRVMAYLVVQLDFISLSLKGLGDFIIPQD